MCDFGSPFGWVPGSFCWRLKMLLLGDDIARSLGLNVEKHRLVFISLAALLAASANRIRIRSAHGSFYKKE